ncbi:hypothetical protein BHE74_00053160 [Ensete ventricosum]|nr:hypothetical protein BHE74_00053160 [Ensete ventricosum]
MHPLRFPNSGIRANVFVRKIGFKLRVMRLYRVESFYAFLLRFRSEGNEEEGRPATTRPHARPATDGQAAAKASPQGAVARRGGACGHGMLRPARKGSSRPQRDTRKGASYRVARASGGCQRLAHKRLSLATSLQGAAARGQPYLLRRGNDNGGAEGGKERARVFF